MLKLEGRLLTIAIRLAAGRDRPGASITTEGMMGEDKTVLSDFSDTVLYGQSMHIVSAMCSEPA